VEWMDPGNAGIGTLDACAHKKTGGLNRRLVH